MVYHVLKFDISCLNLYGKSLAKVKSSSCLLMDGERDERRLDAPGTGGIDQAAAVEEAHEPAVIAVGQRLRDLVLGGCGADLAGFEGGVPDLQVGRGLAEICGDHQGVDKDAVFFILAVGAGKGDREWALLEGEEAQVIPDPVVKGRAVLGDLGGCTVDGDEIVLVVLAALVGADPDAVLAGLWDLEVV